MKIVFLSRLFWPHVGGVEKHVMQISQGLIKKGHTVSVITERYDKKLPKKETVKGIAVYRIDGGLENRFKKFRIWKEISFLQSIIVDADVVHCHDVFFWYLPFRFKYPTKPVYTTFHGYESYPIKKSAIRMRKLSEKLSWGNICIGDFIPKWYGTKPTFVSYGAVDSSKFNMQNAKFKKESAVFIGRLDDQTGALMYAEAIKQTKKFHPKFDLTFVGDGPDKKKLEENFKVFGFQKDPEKYLPKYHFAFVSRYLAILEAFAARKLVFTVYDNPIKEDYLRMAPYAKYIVVAGNADELQKKIAYFLNHPGKEKELVEKAFIWVQKQSWENLIAVYLKLWNSH